VNIFYAEYETSYQTLRAVGATEAQARLALAAAWRDHVNKSRRHGVSVDTTYVNLNDDANVIEMPLGQGFLDWEPAGKTVPS
jgi:hypothetical protein